jgi:hypothetical protein
MGGARKALAFLLFSRDVTKREAGRGQRRCRADSGDRVEHEHEHEHGRKGAPAASCRRICEY